MQSNNLCQINYFVLSLSKKRAAALEHGTFQRLRHTKRYIFKA